MTYWTDYPISGLGDELGKPAPVRECTPIEYDGNKYCAVVVEGVTASFKCGYIYTEKGRCGDVPAISIEELHELKHVFPV